MLAFEIVGKILIEGSEQVRAELEKSGVSAKEAADQVKVLEKQLADLEKVANVAGKAMVAIGTSIVAAAGFAAKTAIEIESTTIAFENLSTSAGQVSGDILSALQKASAGTISANNLMLSANRAMVLGVADNTQEFTALMEIARDRARAMGLTTTQAFNDIVTGIGRGSPLILDNLGLVIDLAAANKEYAIRLGKTTEALTEEEKKQALLNAVLKQGERTIDKNAQAQMTASEATQALKASIEDLTAEIGRTFLPIVKDASEWIIDIIKDFQNWRKENPRLAETLDKVGVALGGVSIAVGGIVSLLPGLARGINTVRNAYLAFKAVMLATNPQILVAVGACALLVGVVATVKLGIDQLTKSEKHHKAMIENLTKSIQTYTEQIAKKEAQLKTEIRTLKEYQDNLAKAKQNLDDLRAEQNAALDSMNRISGTIDKLNQLYDQTAKAINEAQEEVDKWTSEVKEQQRVVDGLTIALGDANDKLRDAQDEYDKATKEVDKYSAALSDLERQINDLSRVRIEGMGEYEDKIHAVNTEIDKTKLAIWEAEKEGKDTTALEAYLDKLYNDLKGLELQYAVAYNDALYQQQKAAEEALGQNVEMSIEDILAGIMSAGEDYAIISDLLADALTDQEAAGQEVEDAQAVVDAIEEVLAGAQEALEYYQEHLDKANDNLKAIEESATNIFNNMMGISQGQSEILNKITQEIANQEKIYDTIKNETLPGIQESIKRAEELYAQAELAFKDQIRVVLSLETEIVYLGALIEHTEQWLASLTEPEEQSYPDISHITPHATGGLITKPTLLSDLATGKPYGTMAETNAEWIVPTDKMGGFTLIQNIDMSGAVVRSDSDIDKMTDMVADKSYKKFTAALASKGIKI